MTFPTVIATSVVRGASQRQSHGGVYLVDLEAETVEQVVDWNASGIDFSGRGWDRGLRGIALVGEDIYIAASDELLVFDRKYRIQGSYRNPYLRHAHELYVLGDMLYATSTCFDSVLGFDLARMEFTWGVVMERSGTGVTGRRFDPRTSGGPTEKNEFHLNSVTADDTGIHVSGMRAPALFRYGEPMLEVVKDLPVGTHNARLVDGTLVYNDTASDRLRACGPNWERSIDVPRYEPVALLNAGFGDAKLARQAFGRGLCALGGGLWAAGSSPSTVSVYDLKAGRLLRSVNISMDVRNAIHGLAVLN